MKLGETAKTDLGRRDAFHAPAVLVKFDPNFGQVKPGDSVRFTDASFTEVAKVDGASIAEGWKRHAVADPFVEHIGPDDYFWVLLVPGMVQNLTHNFDLNQSIQIEREDDGCSGCYGSPSYDYEAELEQQRCAECYESGDR